MPSYPVALRTIHWLMAAIILVALALGVASLYLPRGVPYRVEMLTIHKSLGVTALALVALRVVVRLFTKAPPYRTPLPWPQRIAAHAVHGLLYVVMVAMPVSGYVHSMAGGHGFNWFGLFPVPNLVGLDPVKDEGAGQAHFVIAWIVAALLVAHIGAALWHGFRRDGVMSRMWPGASRA